MHCSTTNITDSSSISTMRNAESEQSSMSSALTLNSFPVLPAMFRLSIHSWIQKLSIICCFCTASQNFTNSRIDDRHWQQCRITGQLILLIAVGLYEIKTYKHDVDFVGLELGGDGGWDEKMLGMVWEWGWNIHTLSWFSRTWLHNACIVKPYSRSSFEGECLIRIRLQ